MEKLNLDDFIREDYFIDYCKNGELKRAQNFLLENPNINISSYDELAFRMACALGHLDIAQWLLQVKPNINILQDDNFAFAFACLDGHLLVAQWLLEVCPNMDISVCNNDAFRNASLRAHLHIMHWLQSIKPYLYVIYYNEDGSYNDYYIRSKEEEMWEQRKYLVWLASNDSPCKNNLFYRIPEDVSRYIISNYLS